MEVNKTNINGGMDIILMFGWFLLGFSIFFEKPIGVGISIFLFMLFAGLVKGSNKNKKTKQ